MLGDRCNYYLPFLKGEYIVPVDRYCKECGLLISAHRYIQISPIGQRNAVRYLFCSKCGTRDYNQLEKYCGDFK